MELKAGDIIYTYCAFISHHKYLICICPISRYFFLINSEARRSTLDAQIKIEKKDFPFLRKDYSYINTATICTIYPDEINRAIPKGHLPAHIKAEIIKLVNQSRHLAPRQQALVQTNLGV